jgi:hypothetical protein
LQQGDLVKPAQKVTVRKENFGTREYDVVRASSYGSDKIFDHSLGIFVGNIRVPKTGSKRGVLILKYQFLFNGHKVICDPSLMKKAE